MKVLLIFLFVVLAGYLIVHMCGGFSGRRKKVIRPIEDIDKSLIILDNLVSLNDRDLSRLKGEIQDLRDLLDKGTIQHASIKEGDRKIKNRLEQNYAGSPPIGSKLSGKELLRKIQREASAEISVGNEDRRPPSVIPRIVIINILLLLITVLVMFL